MAAALGSREELMLGQRSTLGTHLSSSRSRRRERLPRLLQVPAEADEACPPFAVTVFHSGGWVSPKSPGASGFCGLIHPSHQALSSTFKTSESDPFSPLAPAPPRSRPLRLSLDPGQPPDHTPFCHPLSRSSVGGLVTHLLGCCPQGGGCDGGVGAGS